MPSWGVEGGGPLDSQQIDELLAYIEHLQLPQNEVVAAVEGKVSLELSRLSGAGESVAKTKASIEADIAALADAPTQYEAVSDLPAELVEILTGSATCTAETAAAVAAACDGDAADTDRDGVGDAAESALNALISEMISGAPQSDSLTVLGRISFNPNNAFTTADGPTAIPDLDQVADVVAEFENIPRSLRLTLDSRQLLLENALIGLTFVTEAAKSERWSIDFETVAAAEFDGNIADAQRGAALYNAYCARCHTAGYSAGLTFTQEAGSGALGPSLRDGRTAVQFPDEQDHLDFVIKGSAAGELYGLNGIGRGWMPAFGTVLSERDLALIVKFERALR
jgi:mono/diheme cytochrome c family protein